MSERRLQLTADMMDWGLAHSLPQGTQKAWEERLKRNEPYLNSLHFQQTVISSSPTALTESWEQYGYSCQPVRPAVGEITQREKMPQDFFPWYLEERRKQGRGIPNEEENLYSNNGIKPTNK